MVVITPLIVARSQLLTAIDLFFNDRDPISVHALAGNAREILESLCRLAAVEPITELFLRDPPHKPKKEIYAALNLYRNCFKAKMNTCFMFVLKTISGFEAHLRSLCRCFTPGFVRCTSI
jgi:hypothetical protein